MVIFRYLLKEVYSNLLAIAAILLLIFMSNTFIRYLRYAAIGHFSPEAVLKIMAIQTPILLGYMLPLALFIGILLAYGRMYADSEMTVLLACGFSRLRLLSMTLAIGAIIAVVVTCLVFWMAPKMIWFQEHIIAKTLAESVLQKLPAGKFVDVNGGRWVFYAKSVTNHHKQMRDVFAWQRSGHSNASIMTANYAYIHHQNQADYLVLKDGARYTGIPGTGKFQIEKFKKYWLKIPTSPIKERKPEQYDTMLHLWKTRHQKKSAAELQWRIAMPFSVLILTLMALPFSRVKPRQGKYAQLIPAILTYVVYADLIFVARVWIQKGTITASLGIWWVHAVFLALSLILLVFFFNWRQT